MKFKYLFLCILINFTIISINTLYFELKDDEERCYYDEYYYMNVSGLIYLSIYL